MLEPIQVHTTLTPRTLALMRDLQTQIVALEVRQTEALTVFFDGAGHDPSRLTVTECDLDTGRLVAIVRPLPPDDGQDEAPVPLD